MTLAASAARVGLFVPCLASAFDVRATECAARLLEAVGAAPLVVPAAQTCCGQALHNAGLVDDARRLATRMARVFADVDVVVTTSASCAAHVLHHGAPELAPRVVELASFLVARGFDASACAWRGRVAYHPSCHARGLPRDDVAALLARVQDLELVPLPRASQCCGFGGAFATHFPTVSVALGEDKLQAASEAGVTTLVANDAGCRLHLMGLHRAAVEVKHLSEILAEGLHLVPRPPRPLARSGPHA
ncbi:MAG: (Fe-S)-binding protein [Deltaproteobacteria bacterium]|nr:(Fe-S)-binding protein [Deltaproteobacteria bacterium]